MRQVKQDRRSLRTRSLVNSALMELLLEKRFDAITVQDLLDRAGIGRSTFYTHYFDKDDVLASIVEQMLETFRGEVSQQADESAVESGQEAQRIVPSLALFQHVQKQYPQFRALVRGHAGEVLWETGQALLSRNIEQTLIARVPVRRENWAAPVPAIPLAVAAQYLAGAFITLFKWWLEAEMPYTPEEMDHIFWHLALPAVQEAVAVARGDQPAGR